MRTDQLALRLEDKKKWQQLWTALPPDSQKSVARAFARLCVRTAKVAIAAVEERKGRTHHAP